MRIRGPQPFTIYSMVCSTVLAVVVWYQMRGADDALFHLLLIQAVVYGAATSLFVDVGQPPDLSPSPPQERAGPGRADDPRSLAYRRRPVAP